MPTPRRKRCPMSDSVEVVYSPDTGHSCHLPDDWPPLGTIAQCLTCCRYWTFGYTEYSWGPVWHRVRWWHFRARRIIRRWESGKGIVSDQDIANVIYTVAAANAAEKAEEGK